MTFPFLPDQIAVARPDPVGRPGRTVRQLRIEARKAADFGKPLAAALMESLARVLPRSGPVFACIEHWPGDLASDGVIFRLNAGLHALALTGQAPALGALYCEGLLLPPALLDRTLTKALCGHADTLLGWLAHPTQTNEVARVAGLVAALLELGRARAMPCEVLELGASAGLNLNVPRYAVRLGAVAACAPTSTVTLAPAWRGRAAAAGEVAITAARGVDLHPLDVAMPADRESLRAYVWPGEVARAQRLEAAIGIARCHPPQVETGRASAWLACRLLEHQPADTRRVVFHSMVLQYADAAERAAIDAAFAAAGARAQPDRPLARVGIEWRPDRRAVELRIAQWDGAGHAGESRIAAHCHPYGEWIDWHGLA
ncbi:DUF2332 family protein [Porphyrobacter sp. CACIAM 03H1]|uniref:DUF2332 family protein n=1 Tax=Porphyrobacter sp. CACIAM 03H1 TaxID=2003315 RepID=UPI0012FE2782|nr:DUF2332 family protein [Porphyrobacter sp. CACIAM 03H1]